MNPPPLTHLLRPVRPLNPSNIAASSTYIYYIQVGILTQAILLVSHQNTGFLNLFIEKLEFDVVHVKVVQTSNILNSNLCANNINSRN